MSGRSRFASRIYHTMRDGSGIKIWYRKSTTFYIGDRRWQNNRGQVLLVCKSIFSDDRNGIGLSLIHILSMVGMIPRLYTEIANTALQSMAIRK